MRKSGGIPRKGAEDAPEAAPGIARYSVTNGTGRSERPSAACVAACGELPVLFKQVNDRRGVHQRFKPVFEAHARGLVRIAITTTTVAEVLIGPLQAVDEALLRRYRATLGSWQVVPLDADIAESAARIRASLCLRLPDAIQVASALTINAAALVTHDRDFPLVRSLRVIC